MAIIRPFKNLLKNRTVYPVTKTKAVYDDNNIRLDETLNGIHTHLHPAHIVHKDKTLGDILKNDLLEYLDKPYTHMSAFIEPNDQNLYLVNIQTGDGQDVYGTAIEVYHNKIYVINGILQNYISLAPIS